MEHTPAEAARAHVLELLRHQAEIIATQAEQSLRSVKAGEGREYLTARAREAHAMADKLRAAEART